MHLHLKVLSPGKWEGQTVPITGLPFLIGRDCRCQLRPSSLFISKRHCALLLRAGKLFVRDLGSVHGTFVNHLRVRDNAELHNGDRLEVGPLHFQIGAEFSPTASQPTPLPATKEAVQPSTNEEAAAAFLLSLPDADAETPPGAGLDAARIPAGNTIEKPPALTVGVGQALQAEAAQPMWTRHESAKPEIPDTAAAANAILENYRRHHSQHLLVHV
jgi:predicted component of type VI protein secretion system